MPGKDVVGSDEVLRALKRCLEESGDTEEAVTSRIGINHRTLHDWLSDNESPKKGQRKAGPSRSLSQACRIFVSAEPEL